MRTHYTLSLGLLLSLMIATGGFSAGLNVTPPSLPVKLIFIHHSTGGNWLADSNSDQPYGGLGTALMNNNYYVSATNYGWGPYSSGDNTDIPYWPQWFVGQNSNEILAALYAENSQNIGDFGFWPRFTTNPGGENVIVMFKSCFPNSDLFGAPNDPPASQLSEEYTLSNAKAVYQNILTYFQTRPDKLFVVITAPPLRRADYGSDYQTADQRAANARAFNNWLRNDWLDGYTLKNVAVFDYYNVLTGPANHHRIINSQIEHINANNSNFAYYPSDDSHPNSTGHQKATAEFVPLLNYFYHQWKTGTQPAPDRDGDGTPDSADGCPDDSNKIAPGACGCGRSDVDADNDGTPDCNQQEVNREGDGGGSSGCFLETLSR